MPTSKKQSQHVRHRVVSLHDAKAMARARAVGALIGPITPIELKHSYKRLDKAQASPQRRRLEVSLLSVREYLERAAYNQPTTN